MVNYHELNIDQLLLDTENPRIGSVESQLSALAAIINLNPQYFQNMMESIKDDGLDPGDRFYVIKDNESGKFIVLDANRRLSALMVLFDSSILGKIDISESVKNLLVSEAEGFKKSDVKLVFCVEFPDRKSAKKWVQRRHTGAARGTGRIPWNSIEIQRFLDDHSILDIIDFLERNANYEDDEWKKLKTTLEKSSSTVTRIIGHPSEKNYLGIDVRKTKNGKKIPTFAFGSKWTLNILCRIIEDIHNKKIDSRKLNKRIEIERYFEGLPKKFNPPKRKSTIPKQFRDYKIPPKPAVKKTKKIQPAPPGKRETLAKKISTFNLPETTKGEELFREAEQIKIDDFRISSALLLRSCIELAITTYMKKNKLPSTHNKSGKNDNPLSLTKKLKKVIDHIIRQDKTKKYHFEAFNDKTTQDVIAFLNSIVHSKDHLPSVRDLQDCWDHCVPLFESSFGEV